MKVFAISDLHLSTAVEKPMDIFGDGWQNHFAKISEDWQEKVADSDLVLLGGDLSWGLTIDEAKPDYEQIAHLKGQKYVVKGNHDYYWSSLGKMRSNFPDFNFIQNNAYRVESPQTISDNNAVADQTIADQKQTVADENQTNGVKNEKNVTIEKTKGVVIAGSRGWNIPTKDTTEEDLKIYKRELIRLDLSLSYAKSLQKEGDILIAMLHYPPFEATYQDTEVTQLLEKYNVDFVLYGHLHGKSARVTPCLKKHGITYLLTSCDLVDNKLVEVCEI